MTFHHSDILQIAKLARIALSEDSDALSPATFAKEIERILQKIDQISSAKTDGIAPLQHPLEVMQPLRLDSVQEEALLQQQDLLALAPDSQAGLLLVPTVIEE